MAPTGPSGCRRRTTGRRRGGSPGRDAADAAHRRRGAGVDSAQFECGSAITASSGRRTWSFRDRQRSTAQLLEMPPREGGSYQSVFALKRALDCTSEKEVGPEQSRAQASATRTRVSRTQASESSRQWHAAGHLTRCQSSPRFASQLQSRRTTTFPSTPGRTRRQARLKTKQVGMTVETPSRTGELLRPTHRIPAQ